MNLNALPVNKQKQLLNLLFSPSGIQISALKTTMLGNDFSTATHGKWSTYDDTPGDIQLKKFSISRDLAVNGSLTLLKRVIQSGFDGVIQSYMDFPPDWMLVDRNTNKPVQPELYDTLALYMAKYIQEYASHGVRIDFFEYAPTPLATLIFF